MSLAVGTIAGNFYQRSSLVRALFQNFTDRPQNVFIAIKNLDPFAGFTPDQNFPANQQHTLNILVLGCDSDYYDNKPVAIKGTPGRSDAIMMAHLDFDKKTLQVLSIPRDTAVPIPGYRGFHKVNAAHSYGGNDLSTTTIRQDFGINADYTVSLDFDSFQKVVDAVHGVDLTVDKQLDYDDNWGNLHIHLKPGYQHLNGYHAMGFVRIRHTDDDLHRTERQHEFIEALRKKVMSPSNFWALPDVMNAITDDIKANMTQKQMLSLVHWATQLDKSNIHLSTLPSTEDPKFVYADPVKAPAMIADMFFNGDPKAVTLNVASRTRMIAYGGRPIRPRHRVRRRFRAESAPTGAAETAGEPTATPVDMPVDGGGSPSGDAAPATGSAPSTPPANGNSGGNSGDTKQGGSGETGGQSGGALNHTASASPRLG
jgi:LCP family protein required for cell wall assembly